MIYLNQSIWRTNMLYKLYSVYDLAGEFYSSPLCYKTRGEALREFVETSQDERSKLAKHPEDFTFHEIGTYDDQTGIVTMYEHLIPLGKIKDYNK